MAAPSYGGPSPIGTDVAHVTCDSDTTFKVKRPRSPGRFTHCGVYASGSCSGDHENVFTVGLGAYCYVAVRRGRLGSVRRFSAHRRRRGAGHIVAAPAQPPVMMRVMMRDDVCLSVCMSDV